MCVYGTYLYLPIDVTVCTLLLLRWSCVRSRPSDTHCCNPWMVATVDKITALTTAALSLSLSLALALSLSLSLSLALALSLSLALALSLSLALALSLSLALALTRSLQRLSHSDYTSLNTKRSERTLSFNGGTLKH
jgi:hypothetical protein